MRKQFNRGIRQRRNLQVIVNKDNNYYIPSKCACFSFILYCFKDSMLILNLYFFILLPPLQDQPRPGRYRLGGVAPLMGQELQHYLPDFTQWRTSCKQTASCQCIRPQRKPSNTSKLKLTVNQTIFVFVLSHVTQLSLRASTCFLAATGMAGRRQATQGGAPRSRGSRMMSCSGCGSPAWALDPSVYLQVRACRTAYRLQCMHR